MEMEACIGVISSKAKECQKPQETNKYLSTERNFRAFYLFDTYIIQVYN